MALINLHHSNTKNIGDGICSVRNYYDIPGLSVGDIKDYEFYESDVIFGAGMVLKYIRQKNIMDHFDGFKKIGWGVGNAMSVREKYYYSSEDFISKFDLIGVREYGIGLRYVPCPTCKHPVFNKKYDTKREIALYTNEYSMDFSIPGVSKMTNEDDFSEVIEFLGSSEIIITSSYHGVYWSMLLNKKVICVPFNSKFYGFERKVVMCSTKNWLDNIKHATFYDGYKEECIEKNDEFYEDVMDLLL